MSDKVSELADELTGALYNHLGLAHTGKNDFAVARALQQILVKLVQEVYELSESNPDGAYEKDSSYKIALCDVRLMLGEVSRHIMHELDQDRPQPLM